MMDCKVFGRKQSWPDFKVLSQHALKENEKTTKNLSQHSLSSGRNLNAGPPEYKAGVLTPRPRRSIIVCDAW
jgi:hypothetical protein